MDSSQTQKAHVLLLKDGTLSISPNIYESLQDLLDEDLMKILSDVNMTDASAIINFLTKENFDQFCEEIRLLEAVSTEEKYSTGCIQPPQSIDCMLTKLLFKQRLKLYNNALLHRMNETTPVQTPYTTSPDPDIERLESISSYRPATLALVELLRVFAQGCSLPQKYLRGLPGHTSQLSHKYTLLRHARFHHFAQGRRLQKLQDLSEAKLRGLLVCFPLCELRMADIVELSSFVYECPENNRLRPLIATYWVCMIYFHHSYISEALKRLHLDLSVHIFNEQCSLLAQLKNEELFDDLYEHWEAREEAVSSDGHGWDQDDVIRRVVENAFELFNKGSRKFKGNIIFPSTEIQ